MPIDVLRRAPGRRVPVAGVRRLLGEYLQALDCPPETAVSVLLTTDEEVQVLNLTWRGRDRPTDVLSFSMREGGGLPDAVRGALLGDIVISLETARRQAIEKGWTLEEEVAFLLLHGLLHLLGHDHEADSDAERMDHLAQQVWVPLHSRVVDVVGGRARVR